MPETTKIELKPLGDRVVVESVEQAPKSAGSAILRCRKAARHHHRGRTGPQDRQSDIIKIEVAVSDKISIKVLRQRDQTGKVPHHQRKTFS